MITLKDKNKCCGCGACTQICPKNCISLVDDEEGFLYPIIDTSQCIDCGLCEKSCQYISKPISSAVRPINIYAAYNKNLDVRLNSSSGGVFSSLAEYVLDNNGIVFGAAFDENWNVHHISIENKADLYKIRGSKYVQSRTENTYKETLEYLKQNKMVLYSGTPCQILGLKKFLRKEYDRLITVDVICHGVPSPKVWQIYLKEQVKYNKIENITFRDKQKGWRNYSLGIKTTSNIFRFPMEDNTSPYMKGFLKDLYLRPSCYNCIAKNFRSNSDISIADYWWIQNVAPHMDDNKGCSQIYINTEKGQKIIDVLDLYKKETYKEEDIEKAYIYTGAECYSAKYNKRRELFFKKLNNNKIIPLIEELCTPTVKEKLFLLTRDIARKNKCILNIYKKHIKPKIKK